MFRMKITGINKGLARAQRFELATKKAVGFALHREATRIMQESQARAPIVSGKLMESGYVNPPEYLGSIVRVGLGYPGIEAAKLHENPRTGKTAGLSPKGKPYAPGTWSKTGEWKFLQGPVLEALPTMPARFAADLRLLMRLKR